MAPRGPERMHGTAARRPPMRITKRGGPRGSRSRGGGGDDEAGGGGPGWLLPALLVVALLLGASAAWRWWGPAAHGGHAADRASVESEAGFVTGPPRRPIDAPRGPRTAAVRVEILNGSGEPGAAAKLASYLRQGGFNVVQVGSADRYDYLRTLVVARTDDARPSRDVSRYLGDVDRVTQRARSEADVTVVVGKDRGRSPWGEGKDPNGRG